MPKPGLEPRSSAVQASTVNIQPQSQTQTHRDCSWNQTQRASIVVINWAVFGDRNFNGFSLIVHDVITSYNFLTRLLHRNLYRHLTFSAVSYMLILTDFILSYIVIYFVFCTFFWDFCSKVHFAIF